MNHKRLLLSLALSIAVIAPAASASATTAKTYSCDQAYVEANFDAAAYDGLVIFAYEACTPGGSSEIKKFISYVYQDTDGAPRTTHLYPLCTRIDANRSGRTRTIQWRWDGTGTVCGQ